LVHKRRNHRGTTRGTFRGMSRYAPRCPNVRTICGSYGFFSKGLSSHNSAAASLLASEQPLAGSCGNVNDPRKTAPPPTQHDARQHHLSTVCSAHAPRCPRCKRPMKARCCRGVRWMMWLTAARTVGRRSCGRGPREVTGCDMVCPRQALWA
jgi:hypothetical protein